ncbi:efflux RND transporter permease subunit [Aliiroseovarius sp. YM-037]|uniref:efflux RND transporter permease subunit n=1 Tax=Aliiroseovarius sp. YM-037 TaxID=3341728 RepID=UPI003A7FFEFA
MTGLVDWAASRARMVIAFILLSLTAGALAYSVLPKEGEPDIEIPALFISVPFPGISAEDSEKLLLKPMETELSDLDGLKSMSGTAAENYAGIALEFEFGWDKGQIIADVRDKMGTVEAEFPDGAETYSINEINFSEFPIVIVNLTGAVPERTLLRVAKDLQDRLEGLEPVLEATLAGHRDEMLEVVIDPLRLEAYNVTAAELIGVVRNNNQLIAAGEIETPTGAFSVKIPSSFDEPQDVFNLPVKTNGDRVVTLGDLADIRLTFEDRSGTARFNGENTVALQIVKRKGFNIIDTTALVREEVEAEQATWPSDLREAIAVGTSNDQSVTVGSMVSQLEGSVLTAIALVMIVVLGALGVRSALLVGFAIPTSFLLCFVLLALMGITVSNIVMFGLILAVGMLVDGAIVVVEYADRRISEGSGPMHAYVEAAKRMFWPIVSSTATTLCAFLPMLFWPGVPGQFMGMLPVTLIFVLSASLVVALIYLPVMGGVFGRVSRLFGNTSDSLKGLPWLVRAAMVPPSLFLIFIGIMQLLNTGYLFGGTSPLPPGVSLLPGAIILLAGAALSSITLGAAKVERRSNRIKAGYRRSPFGKFIHFIAGNPIMPVVSIGAVVLFVVTTFNVYSANNQGVDFFVDSEPEQAIVFVRQRGNLSLEEMDAAVKAVEDVVLSTEGVDSAFAFAGEGGLNANDGGAGSPRDTIGRVQIELVRWEERSDQPELDGDVVLENLERRLAELPGIQTEILNLSRGPASGKPVHLRVKGDDWDALQEATATVRNQFNSTAGLEDIEDTLPLPGIDWQIDVDVEKAGRYGADVATVGGMVQLVTRGLLLDTMRVDSSDEEIEIRVRLPEDDRVLATLDTLKLRTADGLVPLSNFISRKPVRELAQIDRDDQERYFDIKANVLPGIEILQMIPLDDDGEPVEDGKLDVGFGYAVSDEDVANGDPFNVTLTQERNFLLSLFLDPIVYRYNVPNVAQSIELDVVQGQIDKGKATVNLVPMNGNERIAQLTKWLETEEPLPAGISWEWTGDQEDQAESGAFLMQAFAGALGLMFIILLAQFNSFYNSVLVLLAVVLSTTGVLIGMLVWNQPFSIIMTGTGIVALAGIVVNNNIVLIDTYQEYSRYMPRIEAITRTAQARIRPVLLTTITTMAGLAPMMFGLSLDFINGGYSIDSPTALWWKQLATAVVFGLGIATVLTLIFTPSMLALRVWVTTYAQWIGQLLAKLSMGRSSQAARDWALRKAASRINTPELLWDVDAVEQRPVVRATQPDPKDQDPEDQGDDPAVKEAARIKAAE